MKHAVLSFLLLLAMGSVCPAASIDWHRQAIVDGPELTLGAIADIEAKPQTAPYLAGLVLGPAPAPGQEIRLDSRQLQEQLLRLEPRLVRATFGGADTIIVKRAGILVGADRIRRLLDRFLLKEQKRHPGVRLAFRNLHLPAPFVLPKGTVRSEIRPSDPDIFKARSFNLIFRVDNRVEKNLTVRGSVTGHARVVTLARDLPRGSILQPEDLVLVEREINHLRQPFFRTAGLVGKKLKRSLRQGEVLTRTMIDTPPAVKRGQPVMIVLTRGALSLSAKGIAKRDGKPGDTIPVRNISSQKVILCQVTGPGRVEVGF